MTFSITKRIKSFSHAFRGAATLVTTQHNAWIHLTATIITVVGGLCLQVTLTDWIALIVAISLVWISEALNTGIEFLADEISQERRERIKKAKDVAAFGVLTASVASLTIGVIVFWPYLERLF